MAYPSSDTEIEQSLQTRCSNCLTVFEVSRELLASSDTRVRCGECLSIFDAREGLRSDAAAAPNNASDINTGENGEDTNASEPAALNGSTADSAALDVTYSDFDLFSEEADLPEIAYFDQTRDTASFDFDTVALENDETFSDTLFAHDVTIDANVAQLEAAASAQAADVEFVSDDVPTEPLIFNYRDAEPVSAEADVSDDVMTADNDESDSAAGIEFQDIDNDVQRPIPWLLSILLLVTFAVVIGGMYVSREFQSVSKIAALRPVLQAGCAVFRCKVPPRVDLSALKAVQRNAYSHPTVDNALVLTMGIRNDAEFEQPLPVLVISLSDRNGRTVAKRDFMPKDYLEQWKLADTIVPGKRLDVTLEVKDPGNRATGFELQFRSMR
ncbi:MAG: zinc-ribbon and DUF3426 domain-containing protein [Granulosicoccaceae bacterium]